MKRIFTFIALVVVLTGCSKSTLNKHSCEDPPLEGSLCLPNIFTPNDDGINDVLYLRQYPGGPQITSLDFRVTDAYGTIIFYTTDISRGWNGVFEGATLKGMFQTEVKATLSGGQSIDFTGTVTSLTDPGKYALEHCTECRFDAQLKGDGTFDGSRPNGETADLCD